MGIGLKWRIAKMSDSEKWYLSTGYLLNIQFKYMCKQVHVLRILCNIIMGCTKGSDVKRKTTSIECKVFCYNNQLCYIGVIPIIVYLLECIAKPFI